ncbi:hypothetical protein CAY60_004725 [Shouchella clausii]|uniref:hypothetical protein n=1 Tax=Shouchella clausii TaxID=79880 RepID=UPI000B10C9F9|nr:hypothetical protein [Shouchella clausii]MDP0463271.1 hypothetical protein [Shouchella rhizosphaerae]MBU3230411.1 hypothetical protein [Shouchella clausii]MBU3262390.1 hypothetical protein [Shouchella clausii]MBU3533453.1 hypothetical protein [Shouchella clausii]MBX0306320.1 hypothetical protein [Shouchella clausii]
MVKENGKVFYDLSFYQGSIIVHVEGEEGVQVRRILLFFSVAVIALFATGCIVNAKAAERNSLEALEAFFSAHEHEKMLREKGSDKPILEIVDHEFNDWFTKEYKAKVSESIESGNSLKLFFLKGTEDGLTANSQYGVLFTKVNRQEGTVQYRLHPQTTNRLQENLHFVDIEMTKEDGEWKINDAEMVEAIYADYFF